MDKIIDLDTLLKRANDIVSTSVMGRPKQDSGYTPKINAKIRLRPEAMDWLKTKGPRHYSRINGLLVALMEADKAKFRPASDEEIDAFLDQFPDASDPVDTGNTNESQ